MKKILLLIGVTLSVMLTSCETALYYWGSNATGNEATKYEQLAYKNYDKQTPESICELLCLYEDMVTNPGGTRGVVPPGICAEYGYLLVLPETAETFANHATNKQKKKLNFSGDAVVFYEKGILMFEKEIALYPESAKFLEPLIKKLKH